jgi:hypothetical protein
LASLYFIAIMNPLSSSPWLTFHVVACLLILGVFVGPVQPLAIESATEACFPSPESSIVAVQQVAGNLVSTIMYSLMIDLRDPKAEFPFESGVWILFGLQLVGGLVYLTFNGSYRRLAREKEFAEEQRKLHHATYGSLDHSHDDSDHHSHSHGDHDPHHSHSHA